VRAVVALGKPSIALVTVGLFAAAAARWLNVRFATLVLAASSVVLASAAIKAIPPTSSFPSGHAAYATAAFGIAACLSIRARAPALVPTALLVVPLAMGPALVIKGAHWPLDVVGGYALGIFWLATSLVVGAGWAAQGQE
jgi:undecaprenyl-diphosphatase